MSDIRPASALLGVYLVVLVATAVLLPGLERRLVLCLLAVESIALAASVPFLIGRGARRRSVALFAFAVALISLVVSAAVARGAVPLGPLAWAQLFLLSFAFVLTGLTVAFAGLGRRGTTAQLGATLVAFAMLGNVFFANPFVELARAEWAKMLVIDATLWSNPWLIAGGTILEADPLRSRGLYAWSVIIYYAFAYPGAGIAGLAARSLYVSVLYGAAGLMLHVLGRILACLGGRRGVSALNSAPKSG